MKNTYDSQWRSAKLYLAYEKDELTQLSYLSVQTRNELHEMGIKKISELTKEHLEEIRNGSRISNFLPSNSLFLPRLPEIYVNSPIEVFLDFESVSNLNDNPAQIFQVGFLIRNKSKRIPKLNFVQMTVDKLNKEEEKTLRTEARRPRQ
jgi:predicted RecB family nuclease